MGLLKSGCTSLKDGPRRGCSKITYKSENRKIYDTVLED